MATERYHEVIIPEGREEAFTELVHLAHKQGWGLTSVRLRKTEPEVPNIDEGTARWDAYVDEFGPERAVADIEEDMQKARDKWLGINDYSLGIDTTTQPVLPDPTIPPSQGWRS